VPRLIFKCPYIKGGTSAACAHLENYVRYMATRNGVERIDPGCDGWQATKQQKEMIKQILRDFPLSRGMFEYEDYLMTPTRSNASEFITRALEDNYDRIAKMDNYLNYIATRPRAQRIGSHGLFTGAEDSLVLSQIAEAVATHPGNIWLPIISLRREDAARLGYDKADEWKALLSKYAMDMAEAMKIPWEDFRWYNLWYELREDVLRTYKDDLPERLPLSGQKEFKRLKNLVIEEAVKLGQRQQVFHPDDIQDDDPAEQAEAASSFAGEQAKQTKGHSPDESNAGRGFAQYALGKKYRDGQGVERNIQKAVELFTLAAKQGNSFAAFALGKMYLSDDPALSRNVAAALKWITNAAEHGNQFAQYYLGKLLLKGTDDISQDTNSALRWLLASVEQGNVHAEYALAMAYLKGESVPKDSLKAMELLKRASSREHHFAQYQLGKLLLQGEDVPKDVVAAVHWLTASAMHGNQYAQYALGKLYLLGKGVEKDKDRAAKWFQMAANQGNEYAQYYLKHMDDPMGQSPAAAVITLFHSLANIFREQNQLPSGGIMVAVDRKLLRKIKAKKIAQGHKADDHEPKIGLQ